MHVFRAVHTLHPERSYYRGVTARCFTVALIVAAGMPAFAQEYFREFGTSRSSGGIGPVVPSEYSIRAGTPSALHKVKAPAPGEEDERYNMAVGPVRMSVAVGAGIEWNDNIFLSDHDRESDFILRPLVNVDFMWPFSENNSLSFSLGASWAKYFDHSELDTGGLLISPTSNLALTMQAGPFTITIRDRFSYQEEPYSIATLSNVAQYERYENQAGIEVDWPINEKTFLTFGYDHYNLWTTNDDFSDEDRSIDTVFLRPSYQLTPAVRIGLFGSYSWVNFDSDTRANSGVFLVGPFVDIKLSDYVTLYIEGGYQSMSFDGASTFDGDFRAGLSKDFRNLSKEQQKAFEDSDDSNSWYAKVQLTHTPNDIFEHGFIFTKTAEIGFGSNFYDIYHLEYGATYRGIKDTEISPLLFGEYYETSGGFPEKAWRYGAAIGLRHHFSNSFTVGLDYRFLLKDSDVEDADYYQNLVFLSAYYRF
jgi:hypothetical protein